MEARKTCCIVPRSLGYTIPPLALTPPRPPFPFAVNVLGMPVRTTYLVVLPL